MTSTWERWLPSSVSKWVISMYIVWIVSSIKFRRHPMFQWSGYSNVVASQVVIISMLMLLGKEAYQGSNEQQAEGLREQEGEQTATLTEGVLVKSKEGVRADCQQMVDLSEEQLRGIYLHLRHGLSGTHKFNILKYLLRIPRKRRPCLTPSQLLTKAIPWLLQPSRVQSMTRVCGGLVNGIMEPELAESLYGEVIRTAQSLKYHRTNSQTGTRDMQEWHLLGISRVTCWKNLGRRTRRMGKGYSSDSIGDGPKTRKRTKPSHRDEVNLQFAPDVGMYVYVDLETFDSVGYYAFPSLSEPRRNYCVLARYQRINREADIITTALVYFFVPELHDWTMDLKWIQCHGWRVDKPVDRVLVRRRHLEGPREIEQLPPLILPRSVEPGREDSTYPHLDQILPPGLRRQPLQCTANLGIGVLNINGYADLKLPYLGWFTNRLRIGVLGIVDSRIKRAQYPHIRRKWEDLHPGGDVQFFPGAPNVGGAALFFDSEWAPRIYSTWSDPSNLGIVNEVVLHSAEGPLRIELVYWPYHHQVTDDSNSLERHVERWLHIQHPGKTVDDYIKEILLARRRKNSNHFFVCGDFNMNDMSDRFKWIRDLGMNDAHLQVTEPFFTRYSGDTPTGRIDYIFSTLEAVGVGWTEEDNLSTLSDHRPIWARYVVPGHRVIRTLLNKRALRYTPASFKDKEKTMKATLRIQAAAKKIRNGSSSDTIQHLTQIITDVFRKEKPVKPHQYWSPRMVAGSYWIAMVTRMISSSQGQKKGILRYYSTGASRIGQDGVSEWLELQQAHPHILQYTTPQLKKAKGETQKMLHGHNRAQERLQILEATKRREGDVKRIFQSLGKPRPQVNLSRLIKEAEIITSPEAIHNEITQIFTTWLADPRQGPIHKDVWSSLAEGSDLDMNREMDRIFGRLQLPQQYVTLLHRVLRSTDGVRQAVEQDLQPVLQGPTWSQFKAELDGASNTSAGGPSGLTYGMLRHSPPEVIQLIYQKLTEAWSSNETFPWMKRKILCPIPKPGLEEDPSAYRPIMLLEVIRKLWVGSMVKVIRTTWDKHKILCDSQYGFRAGRSTLAPLIQIINAFEGSMEEESPLYLSSWDISHAFDSPPRWIIELALRRLGVPRELAMYLAYLDDGDEIMVSTPWSKAHLDAATFTSEHGSGQGDKGSPTFWNGVFDILLTALATEDSGFNTKGDRGELVDLYDTGYADDCISGSSTLEGLQRKADIFSAIALSLGLDVAIKKFRTFAINHPGGRSPPPLTIHVREWTPIQVPFSNGAFIKYLGSKQSFDNSSKEEVKTLQTYLVETAERLNSKSGSSGIHETYIKGAPMMKIMYAGAFSSMSLTEARKLDRPLGQHMKDIAHLAKSFPDVLLYSPTALGGLGAPRMSDAIFEGHLRTVIKAQRSDVRTQNSMRAILARQERKSAILKQDTSALTSQGTRGYLSGLLEYLEQGNLFLGRHNMDPLSFFEQPWKVVSTWAPEELQLRTVGDIYQWEGGQFIPITRITDKGGRIPESHIPSLPVPPPTGMPVTVDQFWAAPDLSSILQIRGLTPQVITGWLWRPVHSTQRFRNGQSLNLSRGPSIKMTIQQFNSLTHKCLTGVTAGSTALRHHGFVPRTLPVGGNPPPGGASMGSQMMLLYVWMGRTRMRMWVHLDSSDADIQEPQWP